MSQEATAAPKPEPDLPEEERLRAELYGLLSRLLSGPPGAEDLSRLAALSGDNSELGDGISALSRVANITSPEAATREYNALFIGLGRGELLPYGSYYLTGFLNEKPLAHLRDHMAKLGIVRSKDVKEPEDHIATLCEMMAGLITGAYGHTLSVSDQEAFFNTHLAVWAEHFFTDLEGADGSLFYAPVGKIGRAFMNIEIEAFRMETQAKT
ncbi:MAG: molecular chaperone TorD family protein [Rhodobacter sp.]|nr:molecular chaperone TorD family protein [Rhodobacter sp.]